MPISSHLLVTIFCIGPFKIINDLLFYAQMSGLFGFCIFCWSQREFKTNFALQGSDCTVPIHELLAIFGYQEFQWQWASSYICYLVHHQNLRLLLILLLLELFSTQQSIWLPPILLLHCVIYAHALLPARRRRCNWPFITFRKWKVVYLLRSRRISGESTMYALFEWSIKINEINVR